MGHIKKVKFKNCYGEEIVFKKHYPLYFEQINTFGISGRFTVQELAFCDGQQTIDYSASGKTVPAKFAYWDKENDIFKRKKLERVFAPLRPGILTVYDDWDKYEIAAYPSGTPDFSEPGRNVYKWDVNFISDDPYWKRMPMRSDVFIGGLEKIINYAGSSESFPVITFPPTNGNSCLLIISNSAGVGTGFTIKTYDKPVTVNCENMDITDSTGEDCSHYLDTSANLSQAYFSPGKNRVYVQDPSREGIMIKWHEKFSGVI